LGIKKYVCAVPNVVSDSPLSPQSRTQRSAETLSLAILGSYYPTYLVPWNEGLSFMAISKLVTTT